MTKLANHRINFLILCETKNALPTEVSAKFHILRKTFISVTRYMLQQMMEL